MRRKRCAHCNGRFGLIRHNVGFKSFCSNTQGKRCKQRYLESRTYEMSRARYMRWLAS